jgi:hypothetical protein
MITPPELRQQARRLVTDAQRTGNLAEKIMLLDLAEKLTDTAAILEKEECEGELNLVLLREGAGFERRPFKVRS